MKNAQGFAWPLGSLRAMQEMRLAAVPQLMSEPTITFRPEP